MQWKAKDSPLNEHMKFSPNCAYAKSMRRGVNDIITKVKKVTNNEEEKEHNHLKNADVSHSSFYVGRGFDH